MMILLSHLCLSIGHYVPQLAKLMIQFNKKEKLFNLKGIAVSITNQISAFCDKKKRVFLIELFHLQLGNPVLEFATDLNSRAEYFWSHGLISDSTYRLFTSACNYSRYVSEYYRDSVSSVCSRVMAQVSRETSKFVDKYDVTLDVCLSSVLSQSKVISPQVSLFEKCLYYNLFLSFQCCLVFLIHNCLIHMAASCRDDRRVHRR